MEIVRSEEMGFCFGVRRAINIILEAVRERGQLESLGAIVHNRQVIEDLAKHGVRVVDSLDQVKGNAVAITSHGVSPALISEMKDRGLTIIDTTCPFVRKAQTAARSLANSGFSVVVFGDVDHPEVQGVLGWAGEKGVAMLDWRKDTYREKTGRRIGVLSQTTQSPEQFTQFLRSILDGSIDDISQIRIINTICGATVKRQTAAMRLAKEVDLVLVIGGRNSANTRHLAEVCSAAGVETHHIESEGEIEPAWLEGRSRVGVTAGASTPGTTIDRVIHRLEELAQS